MEPLSRLLEMVSRTFALSIRYLPEALREPVGLSYLLFRVSDCLEDHADMPVGRKVELLTLWEAVLQGSLPAEDFVARLSDLDNSDPEVYVAQQADDLIQALACISPEMRAQIVTRVAESSRGMARWQQQGPCFETVEELDDYMHQVAGLVGYLMTDLFAWYSVRFRARKNELLPMAREIGLGLQTVNIIRGLRKDRERGWIFLPGTFLEQVGISRDQFFDPRYEMLAMQVVEMLAEKAERHLHYGLTYIAAFPSLDHRVRLACMWPLFFAAKTLAISRDNVEVIRGEVKMSRSEVKEIMRRTLLWGWSNRWLARYYQALGQAT